MADRRDQVNSVLLNVLGRSPSERPRVLAAACAGDDALRREVESQLGDVETVLSIATQYTTDALETVAQSDHNDRERRPVVGQRLGHYHLVGWLGAGGMGEVFRARDTALGRNAALKLIPRRFSTAMKLRLLREAEASAKLQHPSIATFYEAGEEAGEAFIAMEFVEGMSLRKRLADGPRREIQ